LTHPERVYIFLLFPWMDSHGTYDGYRLERKACMELYARAAQVKFPAYSEIVVLGADTRGSPGGSETVLVAEGNPNLSEAERAQTLAMMEELFRPVIGRTCPTRESSTLPGLLSRQTSCPA
jgi:hypothetical protein